MIFCGTFCLRETTLQSSEHSMSPSRLGQNFGKKYTAICIEITMITTTSVSYDAAIQGGNTNSAPQPALGPAASAASGAVMEREKPVCATTGYPGGSPYPGKVKSGNSKFLYQLGFHF